MVDNNGETALHIAIEKRAADVVAYLLNANANIMARYAKVIRDIFKA